MVDVKQIKRCFVIGPMRDMTNMVLLKDELLKPILEPHGFDVVTPDQGEIGSIMRQVLLNLEQADILVADITGSNPNVLYELGVYHSFGKPYLVVKDMNASDTGHFTPFDIAEYRFHLIDFQDIDGSRLHLKKLLEGILEKMDKQDWFSNPVTDFYQSPIAEIPTAIGLAKNYRKNFLKMLLPHIFQKDEKGNKFKVEIRVGGVGAKESKSPFFRKLAFDERNRMQFRVFIPAKLSMARHEYIFDLKDMEKLNLWPAEIGRKSRTFRLYYFLDKDGRFVLVDIPTILSTLNTSILQRRKIHADQVGYDDWEILEAQELERFSLKCERFRRELEIDFPITKGRFSIVTNWNP